MDSHIHPDDAFQLPDLFDSFDDVLKKLDLEKQDFTTSDGKKVSVFYHTPAPTVRYKVSQQELLDIINDKINHVDVVAAEALKNFKDLFEKHRAPIQSTTRIAEGIGDWQSETNEAEQALHDVISAGGSFKAAYLALPQSIDKTKLKEKLQADNNILWRILHKLVSLFTNTNIGYSSRHLDLAIEKKQSLEDIKFIIQNHLYGRVDEKLVKRVLRLPENERDTIFLELFKSCIERPTALGGPDLLSLDTLMDTLMNSLEGVDVAEKLFLDYLQYSPSSNSPLSDASEEVKKCVDQIKIRLGAAQETKAKVFSDILENPNERAIKALREFKWERVGTAPKDIFLKRLCEAIIKKYQNLEDQDFKMSKHLELVLRDQMDSDRECAKLLIESLSFRRDRSLHQESVLAVCRPFATELGIRL